jgi:hypothetical protein
MTLFYCGCTIFEKDERILSKHIRNNGEVIQVDYVSLGATTNDVMQVRKSHNSTPIWVSEKYDYLESSTLLNDTLLQLVLGDTGYLGKNKQLDTILVKIK